MIQTLTFLVPGVPGRKVKAHALASELKDDTAPPRVGWERPPEEMGYVAVEDFRRLGAANRGWWLGRWWRWIHRDPAWETYKKLWKMDGNGHLVRGLCGFSHEKWWIFPLLCNSLPEGKGKHITSHNYGKSWTISMFGFLSTISMAV